MKCPGRFREPLGSRTRHLMFLVCCPIALVVPLTDICMGDNNCVAIISVLQLWRKLRHREVKERAQ